MEVFHTWFQVVGASELSAGFITFDLKRQGGDLWMLCHFGLGPLTGPIALRKKTMRMSRPGQSPLVYELMLS